MPASSKAEIVQQAMGSFKTVEISIGSSKVVLRELAKPDREKLDAELYQMKDGEYVEDDKGFLIPIDAKHYLERWIAATCDPIFTIEEITPWPLSLKKMLCEEAKKINGIEKAAETAKN